LEVERHLKGSKSSKNLQADMYSARPSCAAFYRKASTAIAAIAISRDMDLWTLNARDFADLPGAPDAGLGARASRAP
jgi:hypothetical protein